VIEKLLTDSDLRDRYGENGRRYAVERLSLDALMSRYEALFEQTIAGGAP
jgi:glycosyltransferase involved in cell wall biosynthesis